MNYDCIIMNPPYDGNLHLKILEQVINYLKDDNSICVNLSPVRWLQDPLAKYKKSSDFNRFEGTISKYISSVDVIGAIEAAKMFNIAITSDLGTYVIRKQESMFYKDFNTNIIVDKVVSTTNNKGFQVLGDVLEENETDGWRVRIQKVRPFTTTRSHITNNHKQKMFETTHLTYSWVFHNGLTKDGKHWSTVKSKGAGGPKQFTENDPIPTSIPFRCENEAMNFENSTKTTFHRYLVLSMKKDSSFPVNYVPYLGEIENPRTHRIGYDSDWTNEDLCRIFGIEGFISDTEAEKGSEWEIILETMRAYL